MIFSKQSQKILKEWILDFEASPMQPDSADLIPALKAAAAGKEIKTTFASAIAAQAHSNLSIDHQDIVNESKIILADIQAHYKIDYIDRYITLSKL